MVAKKFKRNVLLVLMLVLALSFSAVTLIGNLTKADTEKFVFTGTLNETYVAGNTIEIPTAKVGETSATIKITLPDGSVTGSTSLTLSQSGSYNVEYTVKTGNKILKENKTKTAKNFFIYISLL